MNDVATLHEAEEFLDRVERTHRRLPSYSEYKDCAIPGIRKLPSHWETKPVKHVAHINSEDLPDSTDPDYVLRYVDISNVDYIDGVLGSEEYRFEDAPSRARRRVRHGDTIISTVRTYLKAVAHIARPPKNLIASTGFAVLRPSPVVDSRFLFRAVQSEEFVGRVVAHSVGVSYPAIAPTVLGRLQVPLPPLSEQRVIAGFLDRETAKIDSLVAKKRRLIELLKEKRTALISHAVTKGLNPDAPMKPSGIDWLGDVPAHWEIKKLKYVVAIKSGENITADSIDVVGEYPVYGGNGLRGFTSDFTHDGEHVLIGRQGALCGNVHRVGGQFWASEHCAVGTCKARTCVDWCAALIETMDLRRYSETAAQPGLAVERVLRLLVPHPPLDEQIEIAEYVAHASEATLRLSLAIQNAIDRLNEYRSALISAAVTGQIDVRNLAPETPEEVPA